MDYELDFLKSLVITIVVELLVLIVLVRIFFRDRRFSVGLLVLTGTIASFATLPYLWFIFPLFITSKLFYILVSELTAVIIESFIISGFLKIEIRRAFVLSIACNAISYVTGVLV